jgi:hypothetical protein
MKTLFSLILLAILVTYNFVGCSRSMVGIESSSTFNVNKYDSVSDSDEKPGRFFKDQPDVNDDYQIHFNYLLAKDSEDREWDINGKMAEILLEVNESMAKATSEHKFGDGIEKKYKFDYRKDGKLDITFVRLDKNHKELHEHANNDISPFLFSKINFWRDDDDDDEPLKGMNNPKKIYYNFADFFSEDGGEAGVGVGTTFLKSKHNYSNEKVLLNVLHELHHAQGGGYSCVPGIREGKGHYINQEIRVQLRGGRKLGATYAHKVEGCPQLMDSVYLKPTSNEPYDPYELNCLFNLGKYTHPKLTKVVEKLRAAGKYNWRTKFGSDCKWRNQERDSDGYFLLGSNINILK